MSEHRPPLLVVMGVSGSGKTVVGSQVAQRLGVPFADADDLHPAANIAKMRAGTPLTDADRGPWLDRVGEWLAAHEDEGGVTACSALKRAYRDRLRMHAPSVWHVLLDGPAEVIRARMKARHGHFMPPALLDSQIATLERLQPGEAGVTVELAATVEQVVEEVMAALRDLEDDG